MLFRESNGFLLAIEYDGAYYASLSLEIVRQALGITDIVPKFEEPLFGGKGYPGLEWLQIGKYELPVDKHVQSLVPYRGRKGSFPYVSATDILRGTADPKILEHAIVLVGTTAPGLLDLRTRPDLFGRPLKHSELGVADEAAAAASLMMGQADEGRPVVLMRGVPYARRDGTGAELVRPRHLDLFR